VEAWSSGKWPLALVILFLLGAFLLQSQAFIRASSATYDEPLDLIAGVRYLTCGDFGINPEHPPLAKEWAALPVVLFSHSLRETGPCGRSVVPVDKSFELGTRFLYANHADQLHLWSRSAVSLLGVALLLLIFAAARELFGRGAAVIALLLAAFEPNLIVHASLVTQDMAVTCGFFAASYAAYRYTLRPTLPRAALAGLAIGLTISSKHSGLLILPLAGLMLLMSAGGAIRDGARRKSEVSRLARDACIAAVVAVATLWAFYGFRFGALPGIPDSTAQFHEFAGVSSAPGRHLVAGMFNRAARWRILPEAYLWGLFYVAKYLAAGRPVWILGRYYPTAQWFYFPLVLAIKVPISLLLLALLTILLRRFPVTEKAKAAVFLFVSPALWFAAGLTSKVDLGVRHVLAVFPFLILAAALGAVLLARKGPVCAVAAALLLAFQAFSVVRAGPHLLAYSNELWGGSGKTYKALLDSNTDWGQGLKAVRWWLEARQLKDCWYVDYGTGSPSYYGIPCHILPSSFSYSPTLSELPSSIPSRVEGILLVSAAALRFTPGVELQPYRQFWTATPEQVIGGSVLLYRGQFNFEAASAMNSWARAQQLFLRGEIENAGHEVEASLQIQPRDPRAYVVLARIEAARGNLAASRAAYEKAMTLAQEVDVPFLTGAGNAAEAELHALAKTPASTQQSQLPSSRN
jgi:hypothetical protein